MDGQTLLIVEQNLNLTTNNRKKRLDLNLKKYIYLLFFHPWEFTFLVVVVEQKLLSSFDFPRGDENQAWTSIWNEVILVELVD